jgi:hypothetical protein
MNCLFRAMKTVLACVVTMGITYVLVGWFLNLIFPRHPLPVMASQPIPRRSSMAPGDCYLLGTYESHGDGTVVKWNEKSCLGRDGKLTDMKVSAAS